MCWSPLATSTTFRSGLKNYALPIKGELFNRIYQYVRENY